MPRNVAGICALFCGIALMLSACGSNVRAPITDKNVSKPAARQTSAATANVKRKSRPKVYTVVRGDTLQAIAWRFGLDHSKIARWNNIKNANLIFVGQKLRLSPPPQSTRAGSTAKPKNKSATVREPGPKSVQKPVVWRWPAKGTVQTARSSLGTKGIEILGTRGSPIIAAAPGKVVYSGSGLRGYGNLIIVQHNDTYLSAYAHNEKLLISEGARVRAGQKIATMGNSGTKQVMLHFEIRRNGKAVDPNNYLPRH